MIFGYEYAMRLRPLLIVLALALLGGLGTAAPARAATCPTFHVLHDDHVGALSLPEGVYKVSTTGLSCTSASSLFTEFLSDWNGKLRAPWRVASLGEGRGRFSRPDGVSFTVTRTTGGGGGGGSHGALACPRAFRVTRAERIGPLRVAAGLYRITRLGTSVSCARAAALLSSFAHDFGGKLPGGWSVLPGSAAFVKGSLSVGFRIKRFAGPTPTPTPIVTRDTRCPFTFRVQHRDRIGRLVLPAGPYRIYLLKGAALTCSQASSRFASFLMRPNGDLPSPWRMNVGTATFRRGAGRTGFRVKRA